MVDFVNETKLDVRIANEFFIDLTDLLLLLVEQQKFDKFEWIVKAEEFDVFGRKFDAFAFD